MDVNMSRLGTSHPSLYTLIVSLSTFGLSTLNTITTSTFQCLAIIKQNAHSKKHQTITRVYRDLITIISLLTSIFVTLTGPITEGIVDICVVKCNCVVLLLKSRFGGIYASVQYHFRYICGWNKLHRSEIRVLNYASNKLSVWGTFNWLLS